MIRHAPTLVVSGPWKKSSYSGGNNNCVEVAQLGRSGTAVRDSKDPGGPVLVFGRESWSAFLEGVRSGDFARG